jgi:hypothetical protein
MQERPPSPTRSLALNARATAVHTAHIRRSFVSSHKQGNNIFATRGPLCKSVYGLCKMDLTRCCICARGRVGWRGEGGEGGGGDRCSGLGIRPFLPARYYQQLFLQGQPPAEEFSTRSFRCCGSLGREGADTAHACPASYGEDRAPGCANGAIRGVDVSKHGGGWVWG